MYVLVHSFSPACDVSVLFAKDRAERIFIDRRDGILPDTLFLGRVVKKEGSAFFVDIGGGLSGYLQEPQYYVNADGTRIDRPVTAGTVLFVKSVREAFDEKEIKVSAHLDVDGADVAAGKNLNGYGVVRAPLSLFEQALTDYRPRGVVCDSAEAAARVKKILPETELRVSLESVWETGGIADALEEAVFCCNIPLPSGGSLIIEETAACVCIDVNTGKDSRGVFEVNKEACAEILRQIRLRALGGQMIVDFAGKKKPQELKKLCALLDAPSDVHVWGTSPLGLVELTVRRRFASVQKHFYRQVREKTNLTVAEAVLRKLWFSIVTGTEPVVVTVPKGVLDLLKGTFALYVKKIEERLGCSVTLTEGDKRSIKGVKS